MNRTFKQTLRLSSLGILAILATQSYAAGYRMEFQSASVLADGGDAAVINDATVNWYNAAGITYLPQQLVMGGFIINAPTTFKGNVVAPNASSPFVPAYTASGQASSNPVVLTPEMSYVLPVDKNWSMGITLTPAFGFTEDYGNRSILRYSTIRIYTKTIMISPSVGWRINNFVSLGGGPDFHYLSVLSRQRVNTAIPGTFGDSVSHYSADSWGNGAHLGIMYQMNPCLRFGLNYRTKIVMDMDGYSVFDGAVAGLPPPNFAESPKFTLRIPLPPNTTLSGYWAINPAWAVMGTIAYQQWSVIKAYYATNFALLTGVTNVMLPQAFHNTFDYAIGTHYKFNDQITLRGSLRYIDTPTKTMYREPLFPDARKIGLNLGAHYQMNKSFGFDAMYAHVWVYETGINAFNPVTFSSAAGRNTSQINLVGGQVVWTVC